jgi:predicted nucleic acid-binding protein
VAHYLDTSAIVKLVVSEAQSPALRDWLNSADRQPTSSDLARTELLLAVRRTDERLVPAVEDALSVLTLLSVDRGTFEAASRLGPESLRTLDALHLASALNLEEDLESIVSYDNRLSDAARINGIPVTRPS